MKNILYILIVVTFASCVDRTAETIFYPNEDRYRSSEVVEIDLDSDDLTFKEITDSIHGNQAADLVTFFEIEDSGTIKKVMPFAYSGGLIKSKNVLTVTTDSVFIHDGYSIDQLPQLLARHYSNKGANPIYSDSPKKAIVEISLDTNKTGKELKEFLVDLTRTFDEIDNGTTDSLKLKLMFNYFRQIPPPPPPPGIDLKN